MRNIGTALPQRWHVEREYVKPIEEVRTKAAGADVLLQISIRRCDDPDIDSCGFAAAHRLKLMFLENTQQLDLGFRRKFPNFIQEKRAAVGQFEASVDIVESTREGSFYMTEKLALYQSRRNCSTVYGDHGAGLPGAARVNRPSYHLFSRTGFPMEENGGVGGGCHFHLLQNLHQGWAITYNLVEIVLLEQFFLKIDILGLESGLQTPDFFVGLHVFQGQRNLVCDFLQELCIVLGILVGCSTAHV